MLHLLLLCLLFLTSTPILVVVEAFIISPKAAGSIVDVTLGSYHHNNINNNGRNYNNIKRQTTTASSVDTTTTFPPMIVSTTLLLLSAEDNNENNGSNTAPKPPQNKKNKTNKTYKSSSSRPFFTSFVLVAITIRSLAQLITLPTEIPGCFLQQQQGTNNDLAQNIDWLATGFDVFFVGYGIQTLLRQMGITLENTTTKQEDTTSQAAAAGGGGASGFGPSMAGLECRVTLDVGRERNTMMEKEWGASGARLLLPINVRFTSDEIDLGFPGEDALGGRYCYRLDVLDDCITFIGPQGEVSIQGVDGGCWSTLPITERVADDGGEAKMRFFLDFPNQVVRNDVTLPAGRLFFSGVCFQQDANRAPLEAGESLVTWGPNNNVGILTQGGLTMKWNNWMNLFGALGDTNVIVGRYRVDNVKIRDNSDGCIVE